MMNPTGLLCGVLAILLMLSEVESKGNSNKNDDSDTTDCPHRVVPESWDRDRSTLNYDDIHVFVFGGPKGLRLKGTCDNAIAKWKDDVNLHPECEIVGLKYYNTEGSLVDTDHSGFYFNRDKTGARASLTFLKVDENQLKQQTSFYFDKTFYVHIDNCGTSDKTGCLLFRIEEADDTPCQNGGICATVGSSCQCVAGYSGNNCNTNINDCSPDPCQNGGTCTDGVDSYTCQCAAGYTGDNCETNIDDYSPNPCQNGGTCTDVINSFTCVCEAGYTGEECQTFDVKLKCPHRVVPESWDRDKSTLIFDNIHVFVFGGPKGLRFKGTCDNAIAKWKDDGNLHDSCKIASLKYVMNDSWVHVSSHSGFFVIRDKTGARANLTYMNVEEDQLAEEKSFYYKKTFYVDIDNCGTRNEIGCLLFRIEEADDGLECVDSDPSPTSVTVSSTLTPSAVTDTLAVADPTDNPMVIGVILVVVTLVMAVLICIEITVAAVIFLCRRRRYKRRSQPDTSPAPQNPSMKNPVYVTPQADIGLDPTYDSIGTQLEDPDDIYQTL